MNRLDIISKIDDSKFPSHILIIPDGNGRWAKERMVPVSFGHKTGADVMSDIVRQLSKLDRLKYITLWGFSSDNWKRSESEVTFLMKTFKKLLKSFYKDFEKENTRFIHLGRKDRIPQYLKDVIDDLEEKTKNNTTKIASVAIDFGGMDQFLRVVNKSRLYYNDKDINMEELLSFLDSGGIIPPADLLIRTAGELRTSDIGWLNGAPTELYFEKKYFPDISIDNIYGAIIDFSKRERRLGKRLES
jgi:undecaprenyl diphosphate synthase